jgi:SAM-dependent methyltransferase
MWKRFFSQQARRPSGLFGRFVASRIFDKGNDSLNTSMVALVAACNGDAILEIGFGCGTVVREMGDLVGDGVVEGIDFSDAMMHVAKKRNRHHIRKGRVRLTHGDFDTAAYPGEAFNAVCSANTIYFWPDPALTCSRIHEVLKPGGRVVLAFVDKGKMETMPLDMEVFRPVSCAAALEMLESAGFSSVQAHAVGDGGAMFCVTGLKGH